ncbi:hypothetical protein [Salinarimonas chemoclinalis]|uniref:hypothetical protein n=1 Tax=Salinarimonas chemoclinalis TaxID=3241599 RepID=UPI00355638FA
MSTPTNTHTNREHERDRVAAPKPARETAERDDHSETPPAGPHDAPDLTDPNATPGTGVLPDRAREGVDADPGGG